MQYVSWKTGDPTIKLNNQKVLGNKWTTLSLGSNGSVIVPVADGISHWGTYVNVSEIKDASVLQVRFTRDPNGICDFTGETAFDLTKGHKFSHTWFFKAKKKVPVAVQVKHNGSVIVIGTREFKVSIN